MPGVKPDKTRRESLMYALDKEVDQLRAQKKPSALQALLEDLQERTADIEHILMDIEN